MKMAEDKNKKPTKAEKEVEDWMTKKWRPMMAMMYMSVCAFDFILAPILWAIVQFWETQAANDAFRQWQPLTLQGAGLFHMAMGAVLGITAWSRGQEKLAGAAGGPLATDTPAIPKPSFGATSAPAFTPAPSYSAPQNQMPLSTPAPGFGATAPAPSFGGKPGPIQPEHPEL
jgi:hypothetical protein